MATDNRIESAAFFIRHDGYEAGVTLAEPPLQTGHDLAADLLGLGFFGNEPFSPAGEGLRPSAAKRKARDEEEEPAGEDEAADEDEDDEDDEEDEDDLDDEDLDDEDDEDDDDEDDEDEDDEDFDDPDEDDDYDDEDEEFEDEDE